MRRKGRRTFIVGPVPRVLSASAGEVVDVALTLAPLPREELKGLLEVLV